MRQPTTSPGRSAEPRELPRLRQLDALRAVAVLSVMIGHFSGSRLFFDLLGPFGVRLFFVLSGFLITGILLRERALLESGQAAWPIVRRFYLRRTLRIVPPYYLVLAMTWLAGIAVMRETFGWHLIYLSNVLIAVADNWHGAAAHLWTLAVEEQFYLFWPWLILFFPRRHLLKLIVVTIALAPTFRVVGAAAGVSLTALTVLPPGCLDTLGAGALLALCRDPSFRLVGLGPRLEILGFRLGLPAFLMLVLLGELNRAGSITLPVIHGVAADTVLWALRDTAMAAACAWLVGRAATGFTGAARAVLEWPPLVYLGTISYVMYLIHNFLQLLPMVPLPEDGVSTLVRVVVLIAIDVALASLSWYLVERPVATLKQRLTSAPSAASRTTSPGPVSPLPQPSWLSGR